MSKTVRFEAAGLTWNARDARRFDRENDRTIARAWPIDPVGGERIFGPVKIGRITRSEVMLELSYGYSGDRLYVYNAGSVSDDSRLTAVALALVEPELVKVASEFPKLTNAERMARLMATADYAGYDGAQAARRTMIPHSLNNEPFWRERTSEDVRAIKAAMLAGFTRTLDELSL